jgi:exodeoxyribonuclease VII large subunit
MQVFTLFEINQHIRQAIGLNFPEEYWVEAELSNCKESRGHLYCELLEIDRLSNTVLAQVGAAIWKDQLRILKKQHANHFNTILRDGQKVRVRVTIDFHEKFGLKFTILDFQAEFTLGLQEKNRQETLLFLSQNGYLTLNKEKILPGFLKNIAIVSSPTAAGYQDFISELSNNTQAYQFNCTLFPAAMQGKRTGIEIARQIAHINQYGQNFEAIVLIRGGGSKIDLSDYDDKDLAISIAQSTLPVLTGIGHDIDLSIADRVAHTHLKTPTAVANFILEHNLQSERLLNKTYAEICKILRQKIEHDQYKINQFEFRIHAQVKNGLVQARLNLQTLQMHLKGALQKSIVQAQMKLTEIQHGFQLKDPKTLLNQGYALIEQSHKRILSIHEMKKERFSIHLKDGKITAVPDEILPNSLTNPTHEK